MKSNQKHLITFLIASLGIAASLMGQATSGVISGLVKDSSQAIVAGAAVTVTNVNTGISRTTASDSQGHYRVGELQPGTYQVTVAIQGFSKETRKDIVLMVGQELSLNFTLELGAVEQEVTVTGSAPTVETTSAVVAAVVSQEQLRELPLNGRSFTDLVTLQAEAMTPSNAADNKVAYGTGPQLSVSGARSDANSFMIDGTDINATSNNTPGSAAGVQLGVETIREYQVITSNAKAEFGRGAGGIINAVTRSGTNQWHGSGFEFLRNSDLDARNFFDAGGVPPFKRNQFGGTLGGPIQRDKTFFFAGYEGLRDMLNQSFLYLVPTAAGRLGTGVLQPGETVDARIPAYLKLYPLPNGAILGGGIGEYTVDLRQPTVEDFGSARVDYNPSSYDFLFGRYTISRGENTSPAALQSNSSLRTANQYLTIQEDHIFGPALLNTIRAGYNRSTLFQHPTIVPGSEALTFVPGRPLGLLTVSGIASVGQSDSLRLQAENAIQVEDGLTYTHGNHTTKLGASLERFQWNTDGPIQDLGSWTFSNLRSFLLAGPSGTGGQLLLPESNTYRHIRTTLLAFYAQDDWQIAPRFTVNYGLRWEFTTGLSETDGLLSYLRRGLVSDISDIATGELFSNHIRNLQPRLGFNWGLGGNQKTVLSGGFGIYHNPILHNAMVSYRAQLPFYFRGQVRNIDSRRNFPDIRATIVAAGLQFRDTRHFDHDNFKSPTLYRYNLALQRELPGQMNLRVAYVGSIGRHLARRQALNTYSNPISRPDGSLFFPPTPAPQFINASLGVLDWMSSDANSIYSSLSATLQKRFSRGLTFQMSYNYSKSIDDQSASESNYNGNQVTGEYSPDRTLDRARSSFNVPHRFVGNVVYELPWGPGKAMLNTGVAAAILGGWQIGGILTAQQGVPFSVTSGASTPGYGFTANRPNLKPGVDVNELTQGNFGTREKFFDPTAFGVPAPGTLGNASRNLLLGPALSSVNFTMSKFFSLGERARLQFRSEFFNLFNHTNFGLPSSQVFNTTAIDPRTGETQINPAAGRIDSTSTKSRQIQFGLKLIF